MKNARCTKDGCIHKLGFWDYFRSKEMKCEYCNKNIAVIENWKVYANKVFYFIMFMGIYFLGRSLRDVFKHYGAVILPEHPRWGWVILAIPYAVLVIIIAGGIQALIYTKFYDYKEIDKNELDI